MLKHHTSQINSVIFISNNTIVSAGNDRQLYVVNLEGIVLFKKTSQKVVDLAYSPVSKLLVVLPTATQDTDIKILNIEHNFAERIIHEKGVVLSVDISTSGKHLLTLIGSPLNQIHVWAIESKCILGK